LKERTGGLATHYSGGDPRKASEVVCGPQICILGDGQYKSADELMAGAR
jgi:hypothetical protein